MPDRNKGGNAAALFLGAIVAVIAAYVAWGWGVTSGERADADRAFYQRAAYTEDYIERTCVMMDRSALVECIQEAIEAGREDQRANYDLNAQEDMARSGRWMLLTGIATVVTAVFGIHYVRETLAETRTIVDITRQIGEAQIRAYLSIKRVALGLDYDGTFVAGVIAENSGLSPARFCRFVCEVSYSIPDKPGWHKSVTEYTSLILLGDIPANGGESKLKVTTQFPDVRIPDDAIGDGTPKKFDLLVTVGVFSLDVFGNEVSAFAATAGMFARNAQVVFRDDWARVPSDLGFSSQEELRRNAWAGPGDEGIKPKERA